VALGLWPMLGWTQAPGIELRSSPRLQERLSPEENQSGATHVQAERVQARPDMDLLLDGDAGKDLWIEGYAADRIEYDSKTEIAKLFKSAKVKMLDTGRVTDEVEGEFIQYDGRAEFYTVNNTATGESKPGGGRVKAVIQPRTKGGDDK